MAMSAWKYASAASITASVTSCGDAPSAAAAARAVRDSAWHASCKLTAVGRLQHRQLQNHHAFQGIRDLG